MRKILLVVGALVLTSAGATFASASHPAQICIDSGPDTNSPVSNDNQVDYLRVSVGASDDDHHPPQDDGCVISEGGDAGGTIIHVEVTGAADDDGDTPEEPDLTCTVPAYSNSCRVEPPTSAGGTQILRAWMKVGDTNEPDMAEGPDEEQTHGDYPEPDATDVSEWMWTHGDPVCETGTCLSPSQVTIRYRRGAFRGHVHSDYEGCEGERLLHLWKKRPGDDRLKASTDSDLDGDWELTGFRSATGPHYVTVEQRYEPVPNSEPPSRFDCQKDRSRVIER